MESWALVLVAALSLGACMRDRSEASIAVAFTNASVIDVTGGGTQHDMTLVISAQRITVLGKTESTAVPPNSRVVDASGKFVIPGLWDMHTHLFDVDTPGAALN